MDWTAPGDLHKTFKIVNKNGNWYWKSLADKREDKKTRLLLLWASNKGLEIYKTTTWAKDDDKFKLKPVFEKFKAYTKPQINRNLY